jgi:3-phenylpropionate/trans-cinnamate dioxygenase ferredoxin subunit
MLASRLSERKGFIYMPEPIFTAVVAVGQIEEKSFSAFEVNGTELVICRLRDEYFAVENLCSHALARFNEGRLRGYRIMCPLHGATFDVRSGACTGAPATRPIRSFPVRVRDGQIEVAVPASP